jgi:hypothetical protein
MPQGEAFVSITDVEPVRSLIEAAQAFIAEPNPFVPTVRVQELYGELKAALDGLETEPVERAYRPIVLTVELVRRPGGDVLMRQTSPLDATHSDIELYVNDEVEIRGPYTIRVRRRP